VKYAWIVTQTRSHSIRSLCRALGVSPSGFYAWCIREPSVTARENERLAAMINQVHHECREAYGTERLWRELRDRGESCGRHRVARLRRRHKITTKRRRRFLRTRAPYQLTPPAPNRLSWPFGSPDADRVWAADITHIPTRRGWLYLAVVIDLYSRRVVGWAMADRMLQGLTSAALTMAVERRRPRSGVIHHSDRGSQYCCHEYVALALARGLTMSMTEVDHCAENALAERMNGILKGEYGLDQRFKTKAQSRKAVEQAIHLYGTRRPHTALDNQFPAVVHARPAPPCTPLPAGCPAPGAPCATT
jgi:putative transposase